MFVKVEAIKTIETFSFDVTCDIIELFLFFKCSKCQMCGFHCTNKLLKSSTRYDKLIDELNVIACCFRPPLYSVSPLNLLNSKILIDFHFMSLFLNYSCFIIGLQNQIYLLGNTRWKGTRMDSFLPSSFKLFLTCDFLSHTGRSTFSTESVSLVNTFMYHGFHWIQFY